MSDLDKIEKQLQVKFPPGYRTWHERGYFKLRPRKNYLWLHEAEWIPPKEIPGYDLWRVTIPGLIPFAFNAAGDHWCWSTKYPTSLGEYEIWYCAHYMELGERFAPTFAGWFYRNVLSYAAGGFDEDSEGIKEARRNLRLWSKRLGEIHPGAWPQHLNELAASEPFAYKHPKLRKSVTLFGFITAMDVDKFAEKQFGKRYLDDEVKWGSFSDE